MEYRADALARAARVRLVVMDVDGTLTDGRIYIGPDGEAMKEFSVKDGMGLSMLHKAGVETAIITGRQSKIVERRAAELNISRVWQGCKDKREAWQRIKDEMQLTDREIAYIGDDLNDLPLLMKAGLACCTADAQPEVKYVSHLISACNGGNGAVRDIVEFILKTQGKWQALVDAFAGAKAAPGYSQ
ncbi:KdsC family phosphatase [Anaerovibrio sp.]|uniref:KdsC family phosphatase n=1 Tax=Anaerovibrio sp. TaxID=1872532 RepID=UPI003F14E7CA